MLSLVLAMTLAMAAKTADPIDSARKAFNNCLTEEHNKAVEAKKSAAEFTKIANETCQTQSMAYHDLTAKAERGYGSNAAEADKYAKEEVQNIVSSLISAFEINAPAGSKLQLEK